MWEVVERILSGELSESDLADLESVTEFENDGGMD